MDSQLLKEHLQQTAGFVERHRELMTPGNLGYSDVPTSSGFGPQSPFNEHALQLGDLEAAFAGNLARYCMVLGSIPPHSLKGLWFVDGECKGVHTYGLPHLRRLVNHLIDWAEEIINTEGVEPLLRAGEDTRRYSKKLCPQETDRWLTIEQAMELTGRAKFTINQWRLKGWVQCLDDRWGIMYSKAGLETVMAMKQAAAQDRTKNATKARTKIS